MSNCKISIITINYNHCQGLERTLRSVQDQTFTKFEHIIIDGNSTDGSSEVIEKNKNHFAYAISEPDSGIYEAMNKGISQAKGEYLLFLNSGDYLFDNHVLSNVESGLTSKADLIYGSLWIPFSDGTGVKHFYPDAIDFKFLKRFSLGHPATFIRRELFQKIGLYRTDLQIVSDWAFFVEAIAIHKCSQSKVPHIITVFEEGGISSSQDFHSKHMLERIKVLIENYALVDHEFDSTIIENQSLQKRLHGLNPQLEMVQSNKMLLSILNYLISALTFVLKCKRKWF